MNIPDVPDTYYILGLTDDRESREWLCFECAVKKIIRDAATGQTEGREMAICGLTDDGYTCDSCGKQRT